ncbi:MAG: hypothetical protein IK095_05720 [Oscillospiraceae bacterium]|nr:hypothetical protein [Oscillospiraceae bacterium]
MKKLAALVLALVMVLALCACGGGADKQKLCDGVWANVYYSTKGGFPYGRAVIYSFQTNGRFSRTEITSLSPTQEVWSGKYSVQTANKQIVLKYDKTADMDAYTVEIPYYINGYDHSFVFDVNSSGDSSYVHYPSMDRVYLPWK